MPFIFVVKHFFEIHHKTDIDPLTVYPRHTTWFV